MSTRNPFRKLRGISDIKLSKVLVAHDQNLAGVLKFLSGRELLIQRWKWVVVGWAVAVTLLALYGAAT